jgi:DNA-binding NarL/FixJ family response regulator
MRIKRATVDLLMTRPTKAITGPLETFPPLPLEAAHWRAIVQALQLSAQQARIVELVLRGMCDKQIAAAMGISEPTIRTYLQRISARTRTHGRMELALCVLGISHQVDREEGRHQK